MFVNQTSIGDQLCQHHGGGLQRLYLDLFIFAWVSMLNRDNAHGLSSADNGYTGKAVKTLLSGFWHIAECRVRGCFVQVQRLYLLGDGSDQSFTKAQFGHMYGVLIQAARSE